MNISKFAGFQLEFDPNNLNIKATKDYSFIKKARIGKDLKDFYKYPEYLNEDEEIYYLYSINELPDSSQALLDKYKLTYSLVCIPPRQIGREFVKTAGHYHSKMPDINIGYPEVYTQLLGRLLLYMQRKDYKDESNVLDCVLYELHPGDTITIPPDYAHILINIDDKPGLMAGLYSKEFVPDYSITKKNRGLAYYFFEETGGIRIERNEKFKQHPGILCLKRTPKSKFSPPYPDLPLWLSFNKNPDDYAFLAKPHALKKWLHEKGMKI